MPLPDRGLAVRVFHVSVVLVLAGSLLNFSSPAVILRREKRVHPSAVKHLERTGHGSNRGLMGRCLRRLVHECSRRRDLDGLGCEDQVGGHDDFLVPRVNTQPSCGFEVLTTEEAISRLVSKYSFRFIGDSTTRRLAYRFASIVTGDESPTHPLARTRLDFSTGDLEVTFDWAPACSGHSSVGDMLTTVIDEETKGKKDKRRTVIVTSFGMHDASSQPLQTSQRRGLDSSHAAALATCRDATAQLTHHATAGDSHLSPLVFLLQNKAVKPGGVDQMFLEEIHRVQREEIGLGTEFEIGIRDSGRTTQRTGQTDGGDEFMTNDRRGAGDTQVINGENRCDGERRGVFLVEDVRRNPQCNRQSTSPHLRENAKVVEAKMLWDLIALVDREHSSSPATLQATRNGALKAPEPTFVDREHNPSPMSLQATRIETLEATEPTLVDWEHSPSPTVLQAARNEILEATEPSLVSQERSPSPAAVQAIRNETLEATEPSLVNREHSPSPAALQATRNKVLKATEPSLVSQERSPSPAAVQAIRNETLEATEPSLVNREHSPSPATLQATTNDTLEATEPPWGVSGRDVDAVWSRLQEAASSQDECFSPPCGKGRHMHKEWADFGEEMSRVQGAVVVRRPELIQAPGVLAPANNLDFVQTLQSYFTIFNSSLFPGRMIPDAHSLDQMQLNRRFFDAVLNGSSTAARHLSTYYAEEIEVPKRNSDGYESVPTLVGMADVFINKRGYVWNKEDYVVPKSCKTEKFGSTANRELPPRTKSYEKVFVMNQHWGDAYFHFVVENLTRITFMLDVLRANTDIKIGVLAPTEKYRKVYVDQFLELLGMDLGRVVYINKEIHADLAILPSSTACGKPDTLMVNMLRHSLLQAVYPSSGGVPPPVARPVLVLVVRDKGRRLINNDQVRDALKKEFPSYNVVEFLGTGSILAQLKTFATASLIVAPHGAGLSNIVVSPLHTPVLEIGPLACSACYVHLAMKLQHIYARHPADSAWDKACDSKYEPGVDEILRLVRDLLEAKRLADSADPPRTVSAHIVR